MQRHARCALLLLTLAGEASAFLPGMGERHAEQERTAENHVLTEAELIEYAGKPYDKARWWWRGAVPLGRLNGAPVVAEFICSDNCPAMTVRVIHIPLQNTAGCAAAGGVTSDIRVPYAIVSRLRTFCVPTVLKGISSR